MATASSFSWKAMVFASDRSFETCSESGASAAFIVDGATRNPARSSADVPIQAINLCLFMSSFLSFAYCVGFSTWESKEVHDRQERLEDVQRSWSRRF